MHIQNHAYILLETIFIKCVAIIFSLKCLLNKILFSEKKCTKLTNLFKLTYLQHLNFENLIRNFLENTPKKWLTCV